ncbi:arabinose efflux permease family protein [Burkholderiales bacterium JOSHI_001]|nr:arabinose efflux permease family protein [Burkholderiales bacterium JOSHI_001]
MLAPMAPEPIDAPTQSAHLRAAAALALGAAVSLGLARFSYALMLPPMRSDLGWSYTVAGAMNTVNALGYLLGALAMPRAMARWGAGRTLVTGSLAAALLLGLHGLVATNAALYALRLAVGMGSAATFVAGGLLAARLASHAAQPGLVLGLYYGGTGLGIVACALGLPPLLARGAALAWQPGWWLLGALALVATPVMAAGARAVPRAPVATGERRQVALRPLALALAGYFMFGVGYIGYMTFIVTLLREQQLSSGTISAFYALLGVGVMASSFLWAGLLQRARGGGALALLNALLALATVLPVLWPQTGVAFGSGALFGAVFLSVVASTTALVRHNLPQAAWAGGISAFTIVFAAGQIVGPTLVGWLADAGGGLRAGLGLSAAALALGAVLAVLQRPLEPVARDLN